jgi:hypothetical protein
MGKHATCWNSLSSQAASTISVAQMRFQATVQEYLEGSN